MPYLDNICIKGLKTMYNNKEIKPSIRKFIAKHLLNINKVLADIKQARAIILGHKLDFCYPSIIIVGYRIN